MMIYPPIRELVKKTGSRYALLIETAKRTRQQVEGAQKLSDVKTSKDVTVAVNEIYEDKVEVVSNKHTTDEEKTSAVQEQSNHRDCLYISSPLSLKVIL